MSKAGRCKKRGTGGDRRQRLSCDCGRLLSKGQAYYCSRSCSGIYVDHKTKSLIEPKCDLEAEQFAAVIQKRRDDLHVEEREVIKSLTPEDDSPEAEKRMRMMLMPPKDTKFFVDIGYTEEDYHD